MSPKTLQSELGFLKRSERYDAIKPYSLRFTPPDGSPRHNLDTVKTQVVIHDARSLNPTLAVNGFAMTHVPTEMKYSDFMNDDAIAKVYAAELQSHLKKLFDARHVRVIDYAVRATLRRNTAGLHKAQSNYGLTSTTALRCILSRSEGAIQHFPFRLASIT